MELWNNFVALVDGAKIISIGILIAVNIVTGIAVALKTNTFSVAQVGGWLKDRLLALVVPYFAAGALAMTDDSLKLAVPVAFGFIVATMASKILKNIDELGLPLPIPDAIKSRLV